MSNFKFDRVRNININCSNSANNKSTNNEIANIKKLMNRLENNISYLNNRLNHLDLEISRIESIDGNNKDNDYESLKVDYESIRKQNENLSERYSEMKEENESIGIQSLKNFINEKESKNIQMIVQKSKVINELKSKFDDEN